MRLTSGLMAVLLSAVSLGGCLHFRSAGPCYGVGCPAFATGPSSGSQAAASQAPPAQNSEAAANQENSPAAKKHRHGLRALLKKAKL